MVFWMTMSNKAGLLVTGMSSNTKDLVGEYIDVQGVIMFVGLLSLLTIVYETIAYETISK